MSRVAGGPTNDGVGFRGAQALAKLPVPASPAEGGTAGEVGQCSPPGPGPLLCEAPGLPRLLYLQGRLLSHQHSPEAVCTQDVDADPGLGADPGCAATWLRGAGPPLTPLGLWVLPL